MAAVGGYANVHQGIWERPDGQRIPVAIKKLTPTHMVKLKFDHNAQAQRNLKVGALRLGIFYAYSSHVLSACVVKRPSGSKHLIETSSHSLGSAKKSFALLAHGASMVTWRIISPQTRPCQRSNGFSWFVLVRPIACGYF
jgi:hypothetical protein